MQAYSYRGVKGIFLFLPDIINREDGREKLLISISALQMRIPDAKFCLIQSCAGNFP